MKIFPIFKDIQKQKPIVQMIFWLCFTLLITGIIVVTFLYPFWVIEVLSIKNWRILLFLEIVYWTIVVIACSIFPFSVFSEKRKKRNAKKIKFVEFVFALFAFGLFAAFGVYNTLNLIKDEIAGYEEYSGTCEFTYTRGRHSVARYVVINGSERINISREDYLFYKDYDFCEVIYLPNTRKGLDVNVKR